MCQPRDADPSTPIPGRRGRCASEKAYRRCGRWLPGIVRCGVAATRVSLGAALVAPGLSRAQPADPSALQPGVRSENPLGDLLGGRLETRLPSPGEAMRDFAALNGWVRAWAEPGEWQTPAAAARVALYQDGRLVGSAARLAESTGAGGVLGSAAIDAMAGAERVLLPRPDALAPEQMRTLAGDLTVSLELAGPLTPLGEAELADPDAAVRPGLDGLAVRARGEWSVAFPSEILAAGNSASVRLPAMAARLLGDPTLGIELPLDLAGRHGVVFYRFEVVQVAGVGPGGSAAFLTRGGRVVETGEMTTPGLVHFAESLLTHLEATRIEGESRLGLMGPIDAPRGAASPGVASPMQQSLAALSLLALAETPRVPDGVRARALVLARGIMADLGHVEPTEIEPAEDGVATAVAWVVLAGLDAGRDDTLRPLFDICESMLARHAAAERGEARAGVAGAVLVWALAERAVRTGKDREVAERDLRDLYRAAGPGGLVGLMPWLGWAELRLAGDQPVPAGAALRQVREQVWEHQLLLEDTGLGDRDLAGGIIFTRGGASLPTWATARPAALCATMLGDPRLTTPGEAPGEAVRLVGAMRFLRQLSAREAECAFYPRASLARGGVRAAAWDQRMPPEASAMTLLSLCEFLRSLDAIERRESPAEHAPSR